MPRSELQQRVLTGLVIGLVIICAALGGSISSVLLILVIAFGSSMEYFRIQSPYTGFHDQVEPSILVTLPVIVLTGWVVHLRGAIPTDMIHIATMLLLVAFGVFFILQLRTEAEQIRYRIQIFAGAGIWISLPCVFAIYLCGITPLLLLGVFILIWASDTFAYFGGRAFGKRKLAPRISPNKTWEGFISGLIAALIAAWGLSMWITDLSLTDWMVTGALVAVFGTLGDLLQSVIKRAAGVKDSGYLLPGHGGIWDRFDSFLGCVPIVGIYFILF